MNGLFNFTETVKCSSYDQFIEEEEKKFKEEKSDNPMWSGKYIQFNIETPEQIRETRSSKYFREGGNLDIILKELEERLGKKARFFRYPGVIIGVQVTHEDYYWIGKTEEGKLVYQSCVGGLEEIQ